MPTILVIDDEKSIRRTLREILEYESYKVEEAADGVEGLNLLKEKQFDAVLLDIKMPKMDGMEVLEKIMEQTRELPVIMVSGHGTIDTAVEAVKKGAYDFVAKPMDLNRLLITLRNALEKASLVTETKILKRKVTRTREMLGESPGIQRIREKIEKVAPTDARVLITGENGTGKELVARWIHERSARADGPLVEVNCAAIPSELIESELFGHEKGAFTSAIKQRIGKFEQASGGTLFMDEIGDMSLSAQAKVLRALQENKITRVGADKDIIVDVRVIAATNKDLLRETDKGAFRLDLYHRISVIIMHVPTLNERKDDIPILAERFVHEICEEYGLPRKAITPKAMEELMNIHWTGNIRELHNVMERLVILSDAKITEQEVLAYAVANVTKDPMEAMFNRYEKFVDFRDEMERKYIEYKLRIHNWNVSKTADEIDMQRSHLYSKMEKYGLKREEMQGNA